MRTAIGSVRNIPPKIIPTHGKSHQVRPFFVSKNLGIMYSTLEHSTNLPEEVHAFDEIVYRLSGRSLTRMQAAQSETLEGEVLHVPAGEWHQSTYTASNGIVSQLIIVAVETEPGTLLQKYREAVSAGSDV